MASLRRVSLLLDSPPIVATMFPLPCSFQVLWIAEQQLADPADLLLTVRAPVHALRVAADLGANPDIVIEDGAEQVVLDLPGADIALPARRSQKFAVDGVILERAIRHDRGVVGDQGRNL